MSAFYQIFKRTDELNDPDKPYWRAIQYKGYEIKQHLIQGHRKSIEKLCQGFINQLELSASNWLDVIDNSWIVEEPVLKDEHGNIRYAIVPDVDFIQLFTPSDPGPGILNGGLCCKDK
jgi:hypothetical protein